MVLVDVVNTSPTKMSKFGRASAITSPKLSLDRLSLLSPSQSTEQKYPQMSRNAEEENECFDGFFPEDEEDLDEELRKQRREKYVSSTAEGVKRLSLSTSHLPGLDDMSDVTSGWSSDGQCPLQPSPQLGCVGSDSSSRLVRAQGGSKPVDMPKVQNGRSKGSKFRRKSGRKLSSVRESLLAEAWERKRDHMLHEELTSVREKPKQEELGTSASNCGNPLDSPTRTKSRNRSLTDDDFQELRGCIDLGFRFDENSSTDLCDTLPALEVYYAVNQKLHDSPMSPVSQKFPSRSRCSSPCSSPAWKVASPGDDPEDVKGRLRHWAQAVACSARVCY